VAGKTDIDITLSGHTHGMQMGIMTKKFRWSPAKYSILTGTGFIQKDISISMLTEDLDVWPFLSGYGCHQK